MTSVGRDPRIQLNNTIHMGIVASSTDATPLGNPWTLRPDDHAVVEQEHQSPGNGRRTPMCESGFCRATRQRQTDQNAARDEKRTAVMRNGGMVSIAKRIPM